MPDVVDLRSDTVTRPTAAMRRAMADAEVGDDDYGEDPTVRALEEAFAARLGKPAALFVPSGVMANQIAVRVLTTPGTAVVAGRRQHVVAYEFGAAALNAGIQFIAVDDEDGMLDADDVRWARGAAEHHQPVVSLVSIENTHMAASGAPWSTDRLQAVVDAAGSVPIHMDGARLFNAEVATGIAGGRVGRARHDRHVLPVEGPLRARGLAAGGERRRDRRGAAGPQAARRRHAPGGRAGGTRTRGVARHGRSPARGPRTGGAAGRSGGTALASSGLDPAAVRTNIVTFHHGEPEKLLAHLEGHGVLAHAIAPEIVRFVTHHDVDDAGVTRAVAALEDAP